MLKPKPRSGALLSAVFDRRSAAADAELAQFESALRRLRKNHRRFIVSKRARGDILEIDVFATLDQRGA